MWALVSIVVVCAVVQSLFGVGLLFFGTPVLLAMGYSFEEALGYLLPCSMAVNLLQVIAGKNKIGDFPKNLVFYALPFLVVGLLFVLSTGAKFPVKPVVGGLMILTAFIRFFQGASQKLQLFASRFQKSALGVMGLIHGLSNMGGGLLTLLVNSLYSEKQSIRANVACGYLLMAGSQLFVLIVGGKWHPQWAHLILPSVAVTTYWALGNRLFAAAPLLVYQRLVTGLILLFGLGLLFC